MNMEATKTVWVATRWRDYETCEILGVFATRELAERDISYGPEWAPTHIGLLPDHYVYEVCFYDYKQKPTPNDGPGISGVCQYPPSDPLE